MFALIPAGHQLVNRGDPDSVDFNKTQLIQDGGIYELDLSSIVPNNAFAVCLRVSVCTVSPDIGKGIVFRKKGNSNWYNIFSSYANVTAKPHYNEGLVFISNDLKIEYKTSIYTFWVLDIVIQAYWTNQ